MPEEVGVADGLGLADDDVAAQQSTPEDERADTGAADGDGEMDEGMGEE
jgi:hypothetical protein